MILCSPKKALTNAAVKNFFDGYLEENFLHDDEMHPRLLKLYDENVILAFCEGENAIIRYSSDGFMAKSIKILFRANSIDFRNNFIEKPSAVRKYRRRLFGVRPTWVITWRWKSATDLAVGTVSQRQACPS